MELEWKSFSFALIFSAIITWSSVFVSILTLPCYTIPWSELSEIINDIPDGKTAVTLALGETPFYCIPWVLMIISLTLFVVLSIVLYFIIRRIKNRRG